METIKVMSYGHKYWNKTIEFAGKCSWKAGALLAQKMMTNDFESNEKVIIALCDDDIVGFCTFANNDEISQEYNFTPFVGFVFVDEKYRGNRLSERLVNVACDEAKQQGFHTIYIMSGEIGLYEKYCFIKIGDYETIYKTTDQLFFREL